MNSETNTLTTVAPDDIALVERELERTSHPLSAKALTEKLAFEKTASQRMQDVKKYDQNCRYEVGDFIYKEYDEPLTVGSKSVEHFQGAVILKVVAKAYYKNFHCDMLEVDYPGGGVFRRYVDYMKKTRTQVLLPANVDGRDQAPELIAKADDPRLTELPMTERDLKTLEKHLRIGLAHSPKFFGWGDFWQLASKKVDIPEDRIREIETDFAATKQSAATESLVRKHFGLEASSDLFDLTCLSLDHLLEKKHKKEFILLADSGWGKWHLRSILNALPEGLPLAAPTSRLPEFEEAEKPEMSSVQDFPIKVYLTWREILSGGLKVPRSLAKELSHYREYTFTDAEDNKAHTLYYFPTPNYFLGLRDFYAQANIPQGTSLTLEKTGPNTFKFWVKKSKKKIAVPRLAYDAQNDRFQDTGEEGFTFAEPNKIIFIERETLAKLLPLYEERGDLDLRDLLLLVFKNLALGGASHSLHFLRAYHLVDLLRQTTQEDVETVLLNTSDFAKSDKKKGMFYYQEPYVPKEEAPIGFPAGEPFGAPLAEGIAGEEGLPGEEIGLEAGREEAAAAEIQAEAAKSAAVEKAKAPAGAPAAKKEKPFKKKKPKAEGEKVARPKKSERRVIEEKIAEEESVQEALSAIKEKEDEGTETRAREKKEEFKPVAKEAPKFGLFGDLLKTALKKKDDKTPDAEPEPEAEPGPEPKKK
ncbi:MAG TPA: hypothetical protein VMS75_10835 [Terriglobales bacterium]|nr:hypothetical protein [Terriglobales bacterium]